MKTILLKFSGPLQAWGTSSHFDIRHTDMYPAKSAVLGLVAAALGWRRDDDRIGALNKFSFAVRVDQPGSILEDYHTARRLDIKNCIYVTQRYYLQDAVFVVALGIDDSIEADKIVQALQKPYFQPYMGRRALPLPLDFVLAVVEEDPLTALRTYPWQAAKWYQRRVAKHSEDRKRLSIFSDQAIAGSVSLMRRDKVVALAATGRRYLPRLEYKSVCEIAIPKLENEHDAFTAFGGA